MLPRLRNLDFRLLLAMALAPSVGVIAAVSVIAEASAGTSPGAESTESRASAPIRLESRKTHSRLVIQVDEATETHWKNQGRDFALELKGLSLLDLGAPLGSEAEWKGELERQIRAQNDARLASIEIRETPQGVTIAGKWRFPEGKAALADPRMEAFDFRSGGIVVDFWLKNGPTLADSQFAHRQAERRAVQKKAEQIAQKRSEARAEARRRSAELEDLLRFCKLPLSESTDVFLPFLPVHEPVRFSRWLPTTSADDHFHYFEPITSSRAPAHAGRSAKGSEGGATDAQYVKLALELARQGKHGLAIRTIEFLEKEHPRSPLIPEMQFLRANSMIRLGLGAAAEESLQRMIAQAGAGVSETVPGPAVHAAMYLARKRFEEGKPVQALEHFLWLAHRQPRHKLAWVFHLGAAESLYRLKQTERAEKEYQWVAERAPDRKSKAEGALRLGDLYLDRLQYDQALAAYFGASQAFAPESENFAATQINRAEALYGLGQFDRARDAFEKFIARFPSHPAGWRASFRLGEIFGRRSGEKDLATSRQWFFNTVNQHPTSPGATLARLRLVSCGDHGGFTLESAEKFLGGEAAEFDGEGQVAISRYPAFMALARVRAMVALGSNTDAIDSAAEELQATLDPEIRRVLGNTLATLFRREILAMLDKGKKYEALQFYQERSANVPETTAPTDPDYLLRLSQAASDLGLGSLGGRISESYKRAVAARSGDAKGEHGRAIASTEGGDFGLRDSEQAFTEAKALWVAQGRAIGQSPAKLAATGTKVRELLSRVGEESPHSWERELILSLIDERDKKLSSALTHAIKAEMLMPAGEAASHPDLRLEHRLATLQESAGDLQVALRMYRAVELKLADARQAQAGKAKADKADKSDKTDATSAAKGEETASGAEHVADADAEESHSEREPASALAPHPSAALGVPPVPSLAQVLMSEGRILERQSKWAEAAASYSRAVEAVDGGSGEALENQALFSEARALLKAGGKERHGKAVATLERVVKSKSQDFWKKLAFEKLQDLEVEKRGTGKGPTPR